MPQSTNKSRETLGAADYTPSAGILTIDQAAAMFGCEPLAVQRVIAFGSLPDTRDSKGSVVFQTDAESFIGRRMPNIDSPAFAAGWFKPSAGEVNRVVFANKMRAAAGSLAKITDQQLADAYQANRRATSFKFAARPTDAMRSEFNKKQAASFGRSGTTLSFGEAALATNIRSAAHRQVGRLKLSGEEGMTPDNEKLYASPGRFQSVFSLALADALGELAITFTESRSIQGRANPARVSQVIPFSAFGCGLELDSARLLQLAF